MRYLLYLSLAWSFIWLAGCSGAPARLHYDTTYLKHPTVDKSKRGALLAKARGIAADRRIRFRRGAGRYKTVKANKVSSLPLAALQAIHMASDDSYLGAEMDLLINQKGRGRIPVSVHVDLEGNMNLDVGGKRRAKPKESAHTPKFAKGKVAWTSRSQGVVVHATSLLDPREAAVMQNIPFSRYKQGRGWAKDKGAIYLQSGCDAQIRIFNSPFSGDTWGFAGEARAPIPASVRVVLHEIGHAIHNYPLRKASCEYQAAGKTLAARIKKYNATVRKANKTQDPKLIKFLDQEGPRITRQKAKVKRMARQMEALAKAGPVLLAYKKALGEGQPPTRYGEASLSESFAESYSLYKSDPRALGRLLPQVLKWFRKGGHLRFE